MGGHSRSPRSLQCWNSTRSPACEGLGRRRHLRRPGPINSARVTSPVAYLDIRVPCPARPAVAPGADTSVQRTPAVLACVPTPLSATLFPSRGQTPPGLTLRNRAVALDESIAHRSHREASCSMLILVGPSIMAKTTSTRGKLPKMYGGLDAFSPRMAIPLPCLSQNSAARCSAEVRTVLMETNPLPPCSCTR